MAHEDSAEDGARETEQPRDQPARTVPPPQPQLEDLEPDDRKQQIFGGARRRPHPPRL